MDILGIHHVNIKVADVSEAEGFYCGLLGLTKRADRPSSTRGMWLDAGNQQVHVSLGDRAADNGQHFAMEVSDLEKAVAELEAAGVAVRIPNPDPLTQVVFSDPSGNVVELRTP
jgi:glyoxylase I family protein